MNTTSGFDPGLPDPGLPQGGLPQGWPDVDTLARLANEIFSAQPGEAGGMHPATDPSGPNPVSHELNGDVTLGRPNPAPIGLPGEAELKTLLDAIPDSARTPVDAVAQAFYFLEHTGPNRPSEPQVPQPQFGAPF